VAVTRNKHYVKKYDRSEVETMHVGRVFSTWIVSRKAIKIDKFV